MKQMSNQESDKVSISDFPACIPDEELAFLHDWQKKLYRNVMKDIQRALISLGCTIHGTLLQMNGVEEVQIQDSEDSDSRGDANNTNSDHISSCYPAIKPAKLFMVKHEEHQDFMDHTVTEQMEVNSCKTEPFITPVLQFNIKEESGSVCLDCPNSMSRDINSPTGASVVSFVLNGDEHQISSDTLDPDRRESVDYLNTDQVIVLPDAQATYNSHRDAYLTDHHDGFIGDGSTVRKRKVRKPVKLSDQSTPCKSMSPTVKARMLQSFDITHNISHMQSENYQQLPEEQETLWQSGSSQIPCPTLDQRAAYVQESDTYGQNESVTGFVKVLSHDSDTAQTARLYSSPESEQSLFENESNITHLKTQVQKEQFMCIECGESFSEMAKLLLHETIHTEKSYFCTLCGKHFSERGVFLRHQRIHLRDKPFPCSVCGTSFNEKGVLMRHQKIHTGEKPFQCSLCGKSFSRKDTLIRHQTIHTKERTVFEG